MNKVKNKWSHLEKYMENDSCKINELSEFKIKINYKSKNEIPIFRFHFSKIVHSFKRNIISFDYLVKKSNKSKVFLYSFKQIIIEKIKYNLVNSEKLFYLIVRNKTFYVCVFLLFFMFLSRALETKSEDKVTIIKDPALNNGYEKDFKKQIKYSRNNMEEDCAIGEEVCQAALYERVVSITHDEGSGTGFIVEGDENYLTLLTASHVVRKGNGQKSKISHGIIVNDFSRDIYEKPIFTCAFFTKGYADVGIIKIRNTTNIIFDQIKTFEYANSNEKVLVIDNRNRLNKQIWIYTIKSFKEDERLVRLYDKAFPGMSGSPIIKRDGSLLGILISGNDQFTFGTMKMEDILSLGADYLYNQRNYFAPYICE